MTKEDQRYGRDKSTIVNKTYIESGEYRRTFDGIVDDPKIARVLYSLAKEMLFHRSGTQTEDMYWIDGDTGEIVTKVTEQTLNIKHNVIYSDTVKSAIKGRSNLITLHTHPSSMPPSIADFNAFFQNHYRASLVVCHDGTVFQYESNQKTSEKLFDIYMKRFLEYGYTEKESQLKTLNEIKRNFDIDFWEVI